MGMGVIVDVVVGLSVLFWFVATASSFLVEAVSSWLNIRARALELFMREMLVGASSPFLARMRASFSLLTCERFSTAPSDATDALTALDLTTHPLIRRLYKPAARVSEPDTAPSYVPADLFAKALLDRLSQLHSHLFARREDLAQIAADPQLPAGWKAAIQPFLDRGLQSIDAAAAAASVARSIGVAVDNPQAAQVRLQNVAQAAAEPLRIALGVVAEKLGNGRNEWVEAIGNPKALGQEIEAKLKASLAARPLTTADIRAIAESGSKRLPEDLSGAIRPLVDAANHDIDVFRKVLEQWYDGVMARASGWFRRYAQLMLFAVAMLLAVAFNLDALYVARALRDNPAVREAGVQLGQQIVRASPDAGATMMQQLSFRAAFAGGSWKAELQAVPSSASAASAATPASAPRLPDPATEAADTDALALRAQTLLLTHGSTVGPVLMLQAMVLGAVRDCAKDADKTACRAGKLKSFGEEADSIAGAVCRSRILTSGKGGADAAERKKVGGHTVPELAKDETQCAPEQRFRLAPGGDPVQAVGKLWGNADLVWDVALGKAAWDARLAFAGSQLDSARIQALRAAFENALAQVQRDLKALDAATGLLPELGRVDHAVQRWREAGVCRGLQLLLLSMSGWLITAFMASLGAPMWFDLIAQLTNRRITGPKPEPSSAA